MVQQAHNVTPEPALRGTKTVQPRLQRARVRRAQKAFRVRKENHVNALREKCRELEGVVEEMTNTFIGFSDNLLQSGRADAQVTADIKVSLQLFLVLSRKAAREIDDDSEAAPDTSDATYSQASNSSLELSSNRNKSVYIAPSIEEQLVPLQPNPGDGSLSLFRPVTLQNPSGLPNGPGAGPYMNYLWGLPTQSSVDDGMGAIPYILAGRDSFASRLYFETISLATRSLNGDVPSDFAASMFQYKLKYIEVGKLSKVLSGVLNMLLHGTTSLKMQDRLSPEDLANDEIAKNEIVSEIVAYGGSEDDYLNTWDVERYLKDKWALVINSNTVRVQQRVLPGALLNASPGLSKTTYGSVEAPELPDSPNMLAPTFIPGFPATGQMVLSVQPLVERLRAEAVTIGQGPRWHLANIDAAVQEFFHNNDIS